MQLYGRTHPRTTGYPPLPQVSIEVVHPCTIEAMYMIVFLLGFTGILGIKSYMR